MGSKMRDPDGRDALGVVAFSSPDKDQTRVRTAQRRDSLSIARIELRRLRPLARAPSATSDNPTIPPNQATVVTIHSRAFPSLQFGIG